MVTSYNANFYSTMLIDVNSWVMEKVFPKSIYLPKQLNHFHRTCIFCMNKQSHEICGIRVLIALLHLVFATSFQIIHYFRCKCIIYVTVDVLTWFTSWELPPIMGGHQKQKSITKEVQCNIRLLRTQCTWFFYRQG